jgi:predicted phage baseplate assembly protein
VWLRARLASGHYGTVAVKDPVPMTVQRAPSIHTLSVQSSVQRGPVAPEHLALQGGLSVVRVDPASAAPFDVFLSPEVDGPALYIALAAAPGVLAAGRMLSLHVRAAVSEGPACVADAAPTADAQTRPRWQARGADGWVELDAAGDAANLSRSGLVLLTLPADIQPWLGSVADATAQHQWLRVVWPMGVSDDTAANILPRGLALNGVPAAQLQRLRGETVGSSNGRGGQVFSALRTPIVGPVWLQVREADDHWVTWQEVEDLSSSTATSRDFTLDRSSGDIRFGDGRHGRIPPAGPNNLRLHDYATGGGSRGNRPAGSITQLRSAVPSVESVVNVEAARGGLDTESPAELRDQAFGWLRHRDRAICADDFEVLARKASPEVARAFCVAGRDLSGRVDPDSDARRVADNTVSLVVVPHGSDERPQPTPDLLKSVKDYLDPRRSPAARLVVVGPHYARASVTAEVSVMPSQSAFEVEQACRQAIAGFLHPVTGGASGDGWALGQWPHRSDIHGLLGRVDGVALVRASSLSMAAPSGMPFVVSAGSIDVRVQG